MDLWQVPVLLGKKKRKRYFTGARGGGEWKGDCVGSFHSIQSRKARAEAVEEKQSRPSQPCRTQGTGRGLRR